MDGEAIGVIVGLHDFGAGDIIGKTTLRADDNVTFCTRIPRRGEPEAGFVTLSPPPGMIELTGLEGKPDRRSNRGEAQDTQNEAHRSS